MDQSQGGNPFGRLIEFARPHKTGYIVSVVLAVLGVAFGIVPYFATARMTIELLSGNRDLSFYMVWCLISGGCFVLKAILMGISTRASHEATFEVLSEARRKIASKLTRVPMGYILNTPSGQLKNGMVERIEQLEVPLAHVIPEMTSNLLVPIAIIVYLFVLDWRMALVSLITIPVGMMCYMGMMKEYPKKYGEVVKAGNHMSATTVEYIGGIEVIKAFNQADNSYQKFTDAVHANADLILDWMKDTQKYSAIMMSVWPAALINATHEDVVKAAKAARCHDFISALQEGYQTVIGESGATISGGEKQRISIARAIMKDAPIIILDEATANVDPENEAELQKAIEALTQGKTIIMIAHRLKTVKNADQIIVIDRGKISQQGTHDELIKQAGIYADFVGMREKAIGWKIKADSLA